MFLFSRDKDGKPHTKAGQLASKLKGEQLKSDIVMNAIDDGVAQSSSRNDNAR